MDYWTLTKMIVLDCYPIPLVDELHGMTVFSDLDLKFGCHHIRTREVDIPKTTFCMYDGHFDFMVIPFGQTNASTTFHAPINELFCKHLWKFILVFFDDVLIYSHTLQEYDNYLMTIFSILQKNGLHVNPESCFIYCSKVEYFGF